MIKKIDHLGIAVLDADRALATFRDALGLRLDQIEEIPNQGLVAYHLEIGDSHFELLHPTEDDSVIGKYLAKKGPGVHHVALQVDDIYAERDRLEANGFEPLSPEPFKGAHGKLVLFFHPRTTGGMLLEICQIAPETKSVSPAKDCD